jgi:hypothetical protein
LRQTLLEAVCARQAACVACYTESIAMLMVLMSWSTVRDRIPVFAEGA